MRSFVSSVGSPQRWLAGPLVILLALVAADAGAQVGQIAHDPTDMLDKYLELDIKGVRLDPMSQEALASYTVWKSEPAWGQTVVVTDYAVINDLKQWTIISLSEVVIPVEYKVLGSVSWETAVFFAEPRTERVGFRIKIVGDRWRIAEPILPPHIGQKRMINYVRQAVLDEQEPTEAATLKVLLGDLKKAKP